LSGCEAALQRQNKTMEKKETRTEQFNPESIKEMIEQALAQQTPVAGGPGTGNVESGLSGWQKIRPQASMHVEKVLVPVELEVQAGKVTVYFQLDGAVAESPDVLLNTIEGMLEQGIPVRAWKPKGSSQYSSYRR